jgi:ParB-like chromosome segregation protein Spo0J
LVGKSRPFIANLLRISNLSKTVQEALKNEKISFGQARPLIVLDHNLQDRASFRNYTKIDEQPPSRRKSQRIKRKIFISEEVIHAKSELENLVGSKVQIKKTREVI